MNPSDTMRNPICVAQSRHCSGLGRMSIDGPRGVVAPVDHEHLPTDLQDPPVAGGSRFSFLARGGNGRLIAGQRCLTSEVGDWDSSPAASSLDTISQEVIWGSKQHAFQTA